VTLIRKQKHRYAAHTYWGPSPAPMDWVGGRADEAGAGWLEEAGRAEGHHAPPWAPQAAAPAVA